MPGDESYTSAVSGRPKNRIRLRGKRLCAPDDWRVVCECSPITKERGVVRLGWYEVRS